MVAQIGSLLTNNYPLFIILTAISIFLVAFYLAPTYSTIQSAVDPSARSFAAAVTRSEEHTSELQSLMRISYAVFCLKKKIYFFYTIFFSTFYTPFFLIFFFFSFFTS